MNDDFSLDKHLAGMLAGDPAACNELFSRAAGRLERLARKMLRNDPRVHRWAETADVHQNAVLRLLNALKEARPVDARAFFKLSAEMIRRELLDLARHFYGPEGAGAHHASQAGRDESLPPNYDRSDQTHDPAVLASWIEFHQQVALLPPEEREVIGLLFYEKVPQETAAATLGISVRTLQRRRDSALTRIKDFFPGF